MERNAQWLAGLLEGEGSFVVRRKKPGPGVGHGMQSYVSIAMTDQDVMNEYAATLERLFDIRVSVRSRKVRSGCKPAWGVVVNAKEEVNKLVLAILPHMGERRSLAILNILEWNMLREELPHGNTGRKNPCRDGCSCSRHDRRRDALGRLAGV